MRVRFSSPFPYSIVSGGLEIQVEQSRQALIRRGVGVEFLKHGPPGEPFDLLHAFGPGIGVSEFAPHLESKMGFVVSLLSGSPRYSLVKTAAKRLVTSISALARQRTELALRRIVLEHADRIIVLTPSERDYAVRTFGIVLEKFVVVPNGVGTSFFEAKAGSFLERFGIEDFVLFVGSIVPRKNPLNLARALVRLGLLGVFIGPAMPAFAEYAREFADFVASAPGLVWIPALDHSDPLLPSAYAASLFVCLPSSAETQPLAALEGIAAGKQVILGDYAYARQPPLDGCVTCNPLSPDSIDSALDRVLRGAGQARPSSLLTWDQVAASLEAVYLDVVA